MKWVGLGGEGLQPGLLGHDAADVDEIISDHAEADPALHSGIAPVAAAIETVSPLDHADATLASGAPNYWPRRNSGSWEVLSAWRACGG